MDRIHVVHVITSTGTGGSERALERLVLELETEYRFHVLSLKPVGAIGERLRKAGVSVQTMSGSRRVYPRAVWNLQQQLRTLRPDIVHAWLFQANFLSRLVARVQDVPNISSIRTVEREKIWQVWLDAWTSTAVDRYIAVSQAARQHHVNQGVEQARIDVIPNGLLEAAFEPPQTAKPFRATFGIPDHAFLMVAAGRLRHEKGHRFALKALQMLRKGAGELQRPAWLFLAGEGPEEGALRYEAEKRGVLDRVVFAGVIEDLRPAWNSGDVHLLPSLWEGMPNVVLESAALALPSVAFATGGTPEVILDGKTGYLCEPGDVSAMVERVERLRLDREARDRMGAAARAWMNEAFLHSCTAQRTSRIYQELARHNQ